MLPALRCHQLADSLQRLSSASGERTVDLKSVSSSTSWSSGLTGSARRISTGFFSCGDTGMAFLMDSTGIAFRISELGCCVWVMDALRSAALLAAFTSLAPLASSLFWLSAVSAGACGVGSGLSFGLRELYGSLSATRVGLLISIGATSLRSTARAARGKSLEENSRARRARGSPCTLQGSVGACDGVAISG